MSIQHNVQQRWHGSVHRSSAREQRDRCLPRHGAYIIIVLTSTKRGSGVCMIDALDGCICNEAREGRPISAHAACIIQVFKKGADAQKLNCIRVPAQRKIFRGNAAPPMSRRRISRPCRMLCAKPEYSGAGLKKCAKCLEVFFCCSKECQVATWPAHAYAHKADCKRRVKASAGAREGT